VGERRQLTVMFCDLVGSTALSARMDPEEWRTVVRDYQRACAEVIRRFDGYVAQYLGDGLLIYFGYPAAHEDDAQRAVRTGLEIIQAVRTQVPFPLRGEGQGEGEKLASSSDTPHPNLPPQGGKEKSLQVRIGVHTGLVVISEIGDGGKREQLALGETPNVAARLQGAAEPDTVVVSAATHRLIEGLFGCQDLGCLELKGVATPLQAYRIIGESEQHSRLDVAALRGLTPLVGREEETSLLLRRWEQAKSGEGQVVLLNGEPGIGKSRLAQVLKDRIAQEPHARVEWRCSPYHQNSALYPVIEQVQRLLRFEREDSPEERFDKLERTLKGRGEVTSPLQSDTIPLLASLLSLPLPESYPPLNLTPQRQKQKTLETLLTWLLQEARQQPVLVVVEDLHWVDPSTLELLSLLVDQVPSSRVLVVLTFRPDFNAPWALAAHLTQVSLSRFARRQVEAMVENVAGEKALPPEIIQQIVEKTDGVPLFVEELTKTVLESGDVGARRAVPLQMIPATLHDSLMARLDRLNTAKEIAQLGATIGREFSYELLQAVSSGSEKDLQQALTKLVEAELLYQRGQPPQAHYTFKHALVQDAAYQSLLKSTRQQYHQKIAQVLAERFSETKDTQPELLAHHYTEAGLVEQAIPYWQKAGERASQRSANLEAIRHFTKGLELLKTLPNSPEHAQQEFTMRVALGIPLIATKGYSASEVGETYIRARELCGYVRETPQVFPVLWGLWAFYTVRAELETAHELGKQLLDLAENVQDNALLLQAHHAMWTTLVSQGEFTSVQIHLKQGVTLYDPQRHHSHAFLYGGHDPGVCCKINVALSLWMLGYPDQAVRISYEALTLAQELSHPHTLAWALSGTAMFHSLHREWRTAQEQAETTMAFSIEHGFSLWLAHGRFCAAGRWLSKGRERKGLHRCTGA
jgi:class 3 adenylate cyclase/tetratricopeptide (TPR) repeat protein